MNYSKECIIYINGKNSEKKKKNSFCFKWATYLPSSITRKVKNFLFYREINIIPYKFKNMLFVMFQKNEQKVD